MQSYTMREIVHPHLQALQTMLNPVGYLIAYVYFKTNVFMSHNSTLNRILYQSARLHFVKLCNDRQSLKNALCASDDNL